MKDKNIVLDWTIQEDHEATLDNFVFTDRQKVQK